MIISQIPMTPFRFRYVDGNIKRIRNDYVKLVSEFITPLTHSCNLSEVVYAKYLGLRHISSVNQCKELELISISFGVVKVVQIYTSYRDKLQR